ncbi:MAG: RusA family crossover junction endodeoxyribonuclease, partial [Acidobacteriota bacterium]
HAMAFTPKKTRSYEDIVRQTAIREWNRPLLQDTAIVLTVTFYRGVAASWSKRKTAEALAGALLPIGRPDLDNLTKCLTDGMNGVVYLDDSAIVKTISEKRYALNPRVEIVLTW